MVIFHSYVSLPEGNRNDTLDRTVWRISQRCRRSRRWSVCSRRGSIFTIPWYHRIGMGQNSVSLQMVNTDWMFTFAVFWCILRSPGLPFWLKISQNPNIWKVWGLCQMSSIASHGGLCQADHLPCPEQWVALWRHSTAWIWAGASVGGEGALPNDHMGVSINGGTHGYPQMDGL